MHLASYVQQGLVPIKDLISEEKLLILEPLINERDGTSLTGIKEKCGPSISFGEIRMVIAWKEFQAMADEVQ